MHPLPCLNPYWFYPIAHSVPALTLFINTLPLELVYLPLPLFRGTIHLLREYIGTTPISKLALNSLTSYSNTAMPPFFKHSAGNPSAMEPSVFHLIHFLYRYCSFIQFSHHWHPPIATYLYLPLRYHPYSVPAQSTLPTSSSLQHHPSVCDHSHPLPSRPSLAHPYINNNSFYKYIVSASFFVIAPARGSSNEGAAVAHLPSNKFHLAGLCSYDEQNWRCLFFWVFWTWAQSRTSFEGTCAAALAIVRGAGQSPGSWGPQVLKSSWN